MRAQAYFTPDEVAEQLDISRRWVYEMLTTGRLKATQVGRQWRITPANLRSFRKTWARQPRPAPRSEAA